MKCSRWRNRPTIEPVHESQQFRIMPYSGSAKPVGYSNGARSVRVHSAKHIALAILERLRCSDFTNQLSFEWRFSVASALGLKKCLWISSSTISLSNCSAATEFCCLVNITQTPITINLYPFADVADERYVFPRRVKIDCSQILLSAKLTNDFERDFR